VRRGYAHVSDGSAGTEGEFRPSAGISENAGIFKRTGAPAGRKIRTFTGTDTAGPAVGILVGGGNESWAARERIWADGGVGLSSEDFSRFSFEISCGWQDAARGILSEDADYAAGIERDCLHRGYIFGARDFVCSGAGTRRGDLAGSGDGEPA